MKNGTSRLMSTLACVAISAMATVAYGQGTATSTLSGTVVDASGSFVPGADVVVKNNATGGAFTAVTGENGVFTVPAIDPGSYSVTVSLSGFKTAVLADVRVNAATPATVRVTLTVGELAETVVVAGQSSEIIQTQSSAVAKTLDVNQISNLPLTSRNALDFITFLPGVLTPATNRDSTINGLPQLAINITLDGMSIQDNFNKTDDGFFARLSPRLDAVEEVTVTTAGNGADSSGQGAAQIRFVTRSGSNNLRGSLYHYYRNDALNANTWFNNRDLARNPDTGKAPKADLVQHQPGFRVGGPIVIPGLWDGHNKGFFFVNYEQFRQPSKITRNRTILHPLAQAGIFRYNVTVGGQTQVREVNLLELAAANGHLATLDPTTAKLLADIRSTTSSGQVVDLTDPLIQRFTFQLDADSINHYPTTRVDFNLSDRHRLTGSFNYQHIDSTPDLTNNVEPRFPGFPITGSQQSTRYSTSNALRSALSPNMVNELRVGATGGATYFSPELGTTLWGGVPLGDQAGFNLNINAACCSTALTSAGVAGNRNSREASTKVVEDTLTWLRGSHSVSFGFSYTQADVWLRNHLLVPEIRFGVIDGTPAATMFSAANLPGSSATNQANARGLYAILVGSVSEIRGNARLDEDTGQYEYLGPGMQRGRLRDLGFFMQDSWRVRPNLTVNYGLRYALQMPFYALNNSYTTGTIQDLWGVSGVGNVFMPGVMTGKKPEFNQFSSGTKAYETDLNNFAPSLGFNWQPGARSGVLGKILGADGDSVLSAAYTLAYERPGMSDFTDVFGDNPGVTITATRDNTIGNLGALPLLLRDRSRLGAPAFATTPAYPMTDVVTGDVSVFDPNLQVPYAQSWTAGFQRRITRNTAVEVRYVGSRHLQGWSEYNYNEINIVENGFLDEFRRAQANLLANIAAGRGNTFAFTGAAGTSPLPIYLAYFSGLPESRATDPTAYTSTLLNNATFVNHLARFHPQPRATADALDADAGRIANALRAGRPANFLVVNPDLLGGANLTGNSGYTRYDGLQTEFRKRLSKGLQFQASYVFGDSYESARYSLRTPRKKRLNTGTVGTVTHALKGTWVYDLPFGSERRFGSGAGPLLDRLIGGWAIDGTARIQSGRALDFGNVRLYGMTPQELRDVFRLRFDDAGRVVYMLPQDIIDNTVRAFSVSATSASGYGPEGPPSGRYLGPANGPDCVEIAQGSGDCGMRTLTVRGPRLNRFDFGLVKRVRLAGNLRFEFRAELLNALNTPWFTPVTGNSDANESLTTPIYSSPDAYRVISLAGADTSRTIQIVSRFSW